MYIKIKCQNSNVSLFDSDVLFLAGSADSFEAAGGGACCCFLQSLVSYDQKHTSHQQRRGDDKHCQHNEQIHVEAVAHQIGGAVVVGPDGRRRPLARQLMQAAFVLGLDVFERFLLDRLLVAVVVLVVVVVVVLLVIRLAAHLLILHKLFIQLLRLVHELVVAQTRVLVVDVELGVVVVVVRVLLYAELVGVVVERRLRLVARHERGHLRRTDHIQCQRHRQLHY